MAKCKDEAWQADPNYILRKCDQQNYVEIDVMPMETEAVAQMRLDVKPDHLAVSYIEVSPKHREKRWGTRLYEEALRASCATGKPLSSDTTRSEFSEAFWQKQERKGRARCIAGRGARYWASPLARLEEMLDNDEITASEYKKITANLPQPEFNKDKGLRMWPCERYEMTRDPCPAGYSLDAIRPARKKPARKAVKRRRG